VANLTTSNKVHGLRKERTVGGTVTRGIPRPPGPSRVSATRFRGDLPERPQGRVPASEATAAAAASGMDVGTPQTVNARRAGETDDTGSAPQTARGPPTARTVLEPRVERSSVATPAAAARASQQSEYDRLLDNKYRRLLRVGYDSMARGSIPLDLQHQELVRVGKGKWGDQRVLVTLEWQLFLVVTFEKTRSFGSSKHAQMLVHPVACGFTPLAGSDAVAGGNPKLLCLRIRRPYNADEVGVSSARVAETLMQGAALTASAKSKKKRDKAEAASNAGGGNSSRGSSTAAGEHGATTAAVPAEVRRLLERNVTVEVLMESRRQVEDAVQLLQRGIERASDAIRNSIQEANRGTASQQQQQQQGKGGPRPLPATPTAPQ